MAETNRETRGALTAVERLRLALSAGGEVRVTAQGKSMWPLIREGEVLVVRGLRGGEPEAGQVVLTARDAVAAPLAHRVLHAHGATVIAKGDANAMADPEVNLRDVLGRVVRVERKGTRGVLVGATFGLDGEVGVKMGTGVTQAITLARWVRGKSKRVS